MNLEAINKWLDEEYGCSYTKLEELHDFYFEKYCDLKKENQQLKLINKEYERLANGESRGCVITRVDEYDIYDLIKCKDNWNKLKECLKDVMNGSEADDKEFVGTILDIIQEIEQGSDSNE